MSEKLVLFPAGMFHWEIRAPFLLTPFLYQYEHFGGVSQ